MPTNATELGVAYVSLVPSATGITAAIQKEMGIPLEAAARKSGAAASTAFGSSFAATGKELTKGLTVPILAVGAAALGAAVTLDSAYHTLQQRTGATGDRLKSLKKDFDAVNSTSAASMGHVADVVAQFNQRLNLSGVPLEQMTKQFLVLERVAGAGAPTVDSVAKAMVAWKVATQDQSAELDHLFVASQKTGVPMSSLVDDVTRFAPQMRAAGMSIDATTVLMGSLEKAGVPVSKVFMGINTYLSKVAKSGGDTNGAFQSMISQASDLDKAGHKVQATTLLVEAFGARAGLTISQLVADGKLSGPAFDALSQQIGGAKGQIQKVGDATIPLSVRLKQLWKSIELDIAPIGQVVLPALMGALHGVIPVIGSVAHAFSDLPKGAQEWGIGLALAAAAVGPLLTVLSPLVKVVQILGLSIKAIGINSELAALEGETSFLAMLGPIAVVAAAIGGMAFAWNQDANNRKADQEQIHKWALAVSSDMEKTGVALQVAFQSDVLNQFPAAFQQAAAAANISSDDITRGLALNGDEWKKWSNTTTEALGLTGMQAVVFQHGVLDHLKASYDQANQLAYTHRTVLTATFNEISRLTGVSAADVAGYLAKYKIDPLAQSQQATAKKLMAALGGLATQVKVKGVEIKTALVPSTAETKADAAAWKTYSNTVSQAWSGFSDLLSGQQANTTAGIKQFYKDRVFEAGTFVSDVNKAFSMGYDPGLISRIITAGPEKAGQQLHTLVSSSSKDLESIVNTGEQKLSQITTMALEQARIMELALHPIQSDPHGVIGRWNMAHVGQAAIGLHTSTDANPQTLDQLAASTKLSLKDAGELAANFQIPVESLDAFEKKLIDIHNFVQAAGAITIKVDGDTSLFTQQATAAKWKVSATDAAITIDGIPVKAIEKLTDTKVKIDSTTGKVTLDADQKAALGQLETVKTVINSSKASMSIDATTQAAIDKLGLITRTINGIPFVGSALAASLFATANAAEVQRAAVGQKHMARGGYVDGPIKGKDSVPAYLMPGEVVISKPAVDWFGQGPLLDINAKKMPRFAAGGLVDGNAVAAPAIRALNDFVTWEQAIQAQKMAAAASSGGGSGAPYTGGQALLDRVLWTIRQTESHNDYTARNSTSTASGAYQFLDTTWAGYGGFPRAYLAPPAVQDARAAAWASQILASFPGDIKAVPITWYTGGYSPGTSYGTAADGGSIPGYVFGPWEHNFDSTGPKVNGFARGGIVHEVPFDMGGTLAPGWNHVLNATGAPEQLSNTTTTRDAPLIGHIDVHEGVDMDVVVGKLAYAVSAGRF